MREEKYSEIIHDALNFLDDDLIEEVDRLRGGVSVENVSTHAATHEENEKITVFSQKKQYPWRKWAALVASICLVVATGYVWEMQKDGFSNQDAGNANGNHEIQDNVEGEMNDVAPGLDQLGATGTAPEGGDDEDLYGVQENLGSEAEQGKPQTSVNKPVKELMHLQNYTAVYFSESKNEMPSDDGMVMLSKAQCEVLDKFIESAQRGNVRLIDSDSWADAVETAEGHLLFEFNDGKTVHLGLLGDGKICSYETKTIWIEMDKRVYRIFIEILKEGNL